MLNNFLKIFPVVASIVIFICWMMTYSLLNEQLDYIRSKDTQIETQKERIQQLEHKMDSTKAVFQNINTNLNSISRSLNKITGKR